MKNYKDTSRQKTPWDELDSLTTTQEFIKNKYKENYEAKHPSLLSTNECIIFNDIKIKDCPYCYSINFVKAGKSQNKIQRYFCHNCKRFFSPVTGTIFENHKISISEWIEFCLDILNYGSLTLISKVNKNAINTSIIWLHKLFLILEEYQNNIVLTGKVYIDETFYSVIYRERVKKNGKFLRGLSENQFCIGIGYDKQHVIAIVEGMGKTSSKKTIEAFSTHIQSNSTLIHDDEKSHHELVKALSLKDISYKSNYLKKLNDSDNPLDPINNQCDLLKKFLYSHSGFNRDYLQDYLNFFSFMNSKPFNKLEKVEILLNLALTTRVTLKYRDFFKPKEKDESNEDSSALCK